MFASLTGARPHAWRPSSKNIAFLFVIGLLLLDAALSGAYAQAASTNVFSDLTLKDTEPVELSAAASGSIAWLMQYRARTGMAYSQHLFPRGKATKSAPSAATLLARALAPLGFERLSFQASRDIGAIKILQGDPESAVTVAAYLGMSVQATLTRYRPFLRRSYGL